jgi:sigma-B regulation protein RsbU (phosphoserine phosphatase)
LEGSFSPVDDLLEAGRGLVERVIETGRPDILSAGLFISLLCAPFKARERALGAVLLGRAAPASAAFTAGDEKLLMALAGQAGISIEKAWMHRQELQRQRLEQELVIGRRIQRSLLPESVPSLPGWEFSAYYQSAREVGGDFYDFFEGEDGQLGLFIADVTGKGVPAALMMAFNRAMLRTLLRAGPQYANRPADTLQRLNSLLLSDSRTGLLLTALYASLDPASGRLAYANAGHERPLWLHQASGVCQELISAGPLLGAFQRVTIDESQVKLEPGDLLVFFTDGVTEARSPEGAVFGEERLLETVQTCRGLGAEETARVILQAVQSFSAHTAQADDYTTVVIKRVL